MEINGIKLKEAIRKNYPNQQTAADKLGVSRQTLSTWFRLGKLDNEILQNVKTKLAIDLTETVNFGSNHNGFEERLPQYLTPTKFAKGKEAFKISAADGPRPYYNVDFAEGFEKVFEDEKLAPSYYIDYDPCRDVGWWVNVTGNGMYPIISGGDKVAVKIEEDWQTFLMPNEIYGIITINGFRTIRTVCNSDNPENILLVPYNKNFQTVEISKNIVKAVLKVRAIFKKTI